MAGAGMAGGVGSYLVVDDFKGYPPLTVSYFFIAEASQSDSDSHININLRGVWGMGRMVVIKIVLIHD